MSAEFLFYVFAGAFFCSLLAMVVSSIFQYLSTKSAERRTKELVNKLLEECRKGKKPTN